MHPALKTACRSLMRRPGATALAVCSLAAATGLSTAAFGVLDAWSLRDLPVKNPQELVWAAALSREQRPDGFSWMEYQALAARAHSVTGILAQDRETPRVRLPGREDFPITIGVSDNYFDLLGVKAAQGDVFHAGRGGSAEVVVSRQYWEEALGSDPAVLGRTIEVGPGKLRIIGVLPAGFLGANRGLRVDLFVPSQTFFETLRLAAPTDTRGTRFELLARLRAGVTLRQARDEMSAILGQVEHEGAAPAPGRTAIVEAFTDQGLGAKLESNAVFLAAMVLLVLIAGANLANLRLVENEARRRDTAIRTALGAGCGDLARQHVAEALLLALAGSAAGMLIAAWLLRAAPALLAGGRTYVDYGVRFERRTFAFSAGALIAVTVLGSLIPLADAWKRRFTGLMQGTRTSAASRWLGALVVAQMALVTGAACSAGLLWRSLGNIAAIRPAMDPDRQMVLVSGFWETASHVDGRARTIAAELGALPGVRHVAWARRALLSGSGGGAIVDVAVPGQPKYSFRYNSVSPGYFETTGARVLRGRAFREGDEAAVMVSAAFERKFFSGREVLGAWVGVNGKERQIVGVVEDGPSIHLREAIQPYLYLPFAQMPSTRITFFVESAHNPALLADAARAMVRRADSEFTLGAITPMDRFMRNARSSEELATDLTASLTAAGLLLAAAGLFGVSLFAVAKRTQEFGIRVAMGAAPRDLARVVLGQAAARIAMALPFGWALAYAGHRTLAGLLYGIAANDPWTFAAASAVIAVVGCAAALHPALRAARTDASVALRD